MGQPTDAELLARADRDAAAFTDFYRRHERAVVAFAGRMVRDAELTVDVAAETFARAYEARATFRGEQDSARGWLLGIARHVVFAAWRAGRVLADGDYEQIARDLRCSPAVVRQRVSRGLGTLRRTLSEEPR
jgi:DNA-directed RNA polymerase specialized sigma24 family protein